jgi:hypothetical protein
MGPDFFEMYFLLRLTWGWHELQLKRFMRLLT